MDIEQVKKILFNRRVKTYILEIKLLFFNPIKFFTTFSNKPFNEKVYQSLFYIATYCLMFAIIYVQTLDLYLFRHFLVQLPRLFPIMVSVFISTWIMSLLFNVKINFSIIFWILIIFKIAFGPIQMVFLTAFYEKENYYYLLCNSLISGPLSFYAYFFPYFFLFKKWRIRIIGFLFNWIILILPNVIASLLSEQEYENNYPTEYLNLNSSGVGNNLKRTNNVDYAKFAPIILQKDDITNELISFSDSLITDFSVIPVYYLMIIKERDTLTKSIITNRNLPYFVGKMDKGKTQKVKQDFQEFYDELVSSLNYIQHKGNKL